jgi:starvation-inducible outer membrane lipoprotein
MIPFRQPRIFAFYVLVLDLNTITRQKEGREGGGEVVVEVGESSRDLQIEIFNIPLRSADCERVR